MEGGTTFHFVDGGIDVALRAAFEAAEGRDVLVGGGATTVRQYLARGVSMNYILRSCPYCSGAVNDSSTIPALASTTTAAWNTSVRQPSPTCASYDDAMTPKSPINEGTKAVNGTVPGVPVEVS